MLAPWLWAACADDRQLRQWSDACSLVVAMRMSSFALVESNK